jgi:ubiquinone/menaquinone biosynthesis C-methylase UbiE
MSTASAETIKDYFNSTAGIYEKLTGGSTRRVAEACLPYLPPLTSTMRILDNASGPGIVTRLILEAAAAKGVSPPPTILAVDNAEAMISQFEANKASLGWMTAQSKVLSAERLEGVADASFDAVVMNLGLFALPDAAAGAREMHRVLKPGSVAVVTTWKHSGPVSLLERTVRAIRPGEERSVLPISKDWLLAEKVKGVMEQGGFRDVVVREERTVWKNVSVEDLIDVFTGPFWQRIWKDWSEEEKARLKPEILKNLSDVEKERAEMEMIAWICVGTK